MSRAAPIDVAAVRRALLAHYRRHRRDLPWRRTRDPYAIWVSEIMLQQTRVETVAPRYQDFLERFPTVADLAAAGENAVCEAWAGLGYYRRARHLYAAAVVVRDQGGALPRRAQELQRLPGIGRYTAGAIASIAFGEPAPIVDGNVARVLARLHAIAGSPAEPAMSRRLWAEAEALVAGPDPGDLNQALMELGATVCTPTSPRCADCPVRPHCRAHAEGTPARYPQPPPPTKVRRLAVAFAWIETRAGVWLSRRPLDGLWAGLWEPPSQQGPQARRALAAAWGVELGKAIATVEHTLTHRQVRATVHRVTTTGLRRSTTLRPYRDPLSAPLSALARKVIETVRR